MGHCGSKNLSQASEPHKVKTTPYTCAPKLPPTPLDVKVVSKQRKKPILKPIVKPTVCESVVKSVDDKHDEPAHESTDTSTPEMQDQPKRKERAPRRRLSVSQTSKTAKPTTKETEAFKTEEALKTEEEEIVTPKGTIKKVQDVKSLLDLFPRHKGRRMSLVGAPADSYQKGFENKCFQILHDGTAQEKGDDSSLPVREIIKNVGLVCKKGLKPENPNQDDFSLIRTDDLGIYGVFDGHGPTGHDVSHFVHENVLKELVIHKDFVDNPCNALRDAFITTHTKCEDQTAVLANGKTIDCALSGTTATVIVHKNDKIFIAHCGDSRAVIATKKDASMRYIASDLTMDHKPDLETERARIDACGGTVLRLEGDVPHRVFVRGRMYPGLAMSRALGDLVAQTVGVSCVPDVNELSINSPDFKFFLLCSDGVWEFITSQEAVDMVAQYGKERVQEAVEALAQESWRRWIVEEENIVDDITVICVWL